MKDEATTKTSPERSCVGCRCLAPRDNFIRIVRQYSEQGNGSRKVAIANGMGRSAYLCYSSACLKKVRKKNRLKAALRTPVPDEIYTQLAELIAQSSLQPHSADSF